MARAGPGGQGAADVSPERYAAPVSKRHPPHLLVLSLVLGCAERHQSKPSDPAGETSETGQPDDSGGDTSEEDGPDWGAGPRTLRGNAYFFTMETLGDIDQVTDVEGAEVYVLEAPELRQVLDPSDEHAFALTGIPDGVEVTIALVHDDFYPSLTATLPVDGGDLAKLHFQAVSHDLLALTAGLFSVDVSDDSICHMVTTVTAISDNQDLWWAVGEPGATVTLDPAVPEAAGPFYFNTMVLPDRTLAETTTDGGVTVLGVEPGVYRWTAHKPSYTFDPLKLTCVGGWVTNAAPPWGLQAQLDE